ncbi:MAG: hypothetical protein FWD13_10200 [Treponema sp.]|nr:hypothetical protein [Treponema sp.]
MNSNFKIYRVPDNSSIERDIFVEGIGLLRYTLSNDINIILDAIIKYTGYQISDSTDEIPWLINPKLSENVKRTMNKYNMNYSMTAFNLDYYKDIIINKRIGNVWYIAGYEIYL